jgi:acyl carrier protein
MPPSRASIRAAVVESLVEIVGARAERIADDDHLVDQLGLDSLNTATCLVSVEQILGTRVPAGCEADLADLKTVGELVERLEAIFSEGSPR